MTKNIKSKTIEQVMADADELIRTIDSDAVKEIMKLINIYGTEGKKSKTSLVCRKIK